MTTMSSQVWSRPCCENQLHTLTQANSAYVHKTEGHAKLCVTESDRDVHCTAGKQVMLAENMQNGMVRLKEGGEGWGLFPVLQPSGNPYAETHPTGDHWLQSMWKEGTNSTTTQPK